MTLVIDRSDLHMQVTLTRDDAVRLLTGQIDKLTLTQPGGYQVDVTLENPSLTEARALMFRQGLGGREFHNATVY